MRDVFDAPKCGLLCAFCKASIAKIGVEGSEVEQCELALESSCSEFVHDDVLTIELDAADAVLEVSIPDEHLVLHVEELDIAVVVTCSHDSLFIVVGVAEAV